MTLVESICRFCGVHIFSRVKLRYCADCEIFSNRDAISTAYLRRSFSRGFLR